MAAPRLSIGSTFAGEYKIARAIAEGDERSVYQAEHLTTGKSVALKVLAEGLVTDRDAFVAEVRVGGKIQTEHLVDVRAAGIDAETKLPWLAMELLEGKSLRKRLDERVGPPMPEWDEVLSQTLRGLAAVHKAGVVHGGVQPHSVFLAVPGSAGEPFRVELFDIGTPAIARGKPASDADHLPYLAPEQVQGGAVGPTADVWAAAMLAFEMVTHVRYWKASTEAALKSEITSGTYEAPSLRARALGAKYQPTPAFDAWFAKCVALDPQKRWADADAALEGGAELFAEASDVSTQDIEDVREPPRSAVPPPLPPMVRRIAQNPKPAIFAILILVGVALGGGFVLGALKPKPGAGSKSKAMEWARKSKDEAEKACNGGDATACYGLGMMYQAGVKLAADEKRAAELYQKACDAGDVAACGSLAVLLLGAEGGARNPTRAAELHQKACDAGYGESCADLAGMYESGTGVTADAAKAKAFHQRACKAGVAEECK